MRTFGGAWAALVTPFTADNRVNEPVLQDLTEYLLGKGVEGFYLCGFTGQGMNMSWPIKFSLIVTFIAFCLLFFSLLLSRIRLERLKQRIEEINEILDNMKLII